jgi:hypothetical protein
VRGAVRGEGWMGMALFHLLELALKALTRIITTVCRHRELNELRALMR